MRILIFGKTGQVGRELRRNFWPVDTIVSQLDRQQCDFTNPAHPANCILETQPDIVINVAAYTAVDRAETESDKARIINCDAPAAMARACKAIDAKLIHVSTDYVFNGSKCTPYTEGDPVGPLSVYGRTKEEGEVAIRNLLSKHVILRTSWVFAAHGSNFVNSMLRLGSDRAELSIVADQRGAPTAARDVASTIGDIAHAIAAGDGAWGTYHYASDEPVSWYEFAQAIFAMWGRGPTLVPISTAAYNAPARRPLYSVLDCGRIAKDYRIPQPSWRRALSDVLNEVQALAGR